MKNILLIFTTILFSFQLNAQLTVETSTGNVGIKDSSPDPDVALTVNGHQSLQNGGTRYLLFKNTWNGSLSNSIDKNGIMWRTPNQATDTNFVQTYNFEQNKMFFDDDTDYTNGVTMSLTQGGDVGIGTNDPLNRLHVNGDALFNSSAGNLKFGFPTSNGFGLATTGGGATLLFYSYTNTSTEAGTVLRMSLKNTGVLEMMGDIAVTGEYLGLSDKRVKKNIETIDNGLELVKEMNPVSYDFKTSEFPDLQLNEGKQLGLIAQELLKVEPNLVSNNGKSITMENNEMELMSVNYIEVIPLLISAIQELSEELENRDLVIAQNVKDYDRMEARLAALESMMSSSNSEVVDDAKSSNK